MAMFIWRLAAGALALFALLTGFTVAIAPAFPSQVVALALAEGEEGQSSIYLLDMRSGVSARITPEFSQATLPTWSPDGSRLAFVSKEESGDQLYVMHLTEPGLQLLTADLPGRVFYYMQWSPSGEQIVAHTTRGPEAEVLVFNGCDSGIYAGFLRLCD